MPDVSLSAGVDTIGVAAGMASIENTVKQAASSIGETLRSYLAVGALIAEFHKIATAAEEIHLQSARFGIDAEQLQVVTNAAKQLGLDMGQVARAMNLLELNAQKAIDPSTKQALAMEHLGISAKAFAALNVDQKFFTLADAYRNSAQDGQAYADVAELIGKRNTELIPLLAEGSKAIIDRGKSMRIMSNEEVDTLHALKIEEEKYLASLDGILAQAIVGWGRLFTTIKKEADEFAAWASRNGSIFSASSWQVNSFGIPIYVGNSGNNWTTGAATLPPPSAASLINHPPGAGAGAPVGITDLSAGGGGGGGGGRGGGITITADLAGLNNAEKLNELLQTRNELVAKINSAEEQGDEHAASRYQLTTKLAAVDKDIATIQQVINLAEIQGIQAADQKIQKSQDRVALDQLDLQISDALNKGNAYGAFLLQNQANILKINLDFDEKIQKALDDANTARAKGLEQTAQENELLAQQLETERQSVLALEQQKEAQDRQRISQGPNPLTINALAQNNLRLGATGDVYAQALAASLGIQPGTPEYERLLQQTQAGDMLRMLQGKNLSGADQLARDKLVRWFADQQQQKTTGAADQSHRDEIAFWEAIAAGRSPGNNPYTSIFGSSPFTSANIIPGQNNTTQITQLQSQIDLQQQQLTALQGIQKNTEIVHVP